MQKIGVEIDLEMSYCSRYSDGAEWLVLQDGSLCGGHRAYRDLQSKCISGQNLLSSVHIHVPNL